MMRYVNRKTLLIVVVLSVPLGVLLPHLEETLYGRHAAHDYVSMDLPLKLSETNVQEIGRRSFGLISPQWIAERAPFHGIVVERQGWPFRAAYTLSWTDATGVSRSGETGLLWWGLIGNLLSSIFAAGASYFAFAYARHRWSMWRRSKMKGICRQCKYEVADLAVCPECGTAP